MRIKTAVQVLTLLTLSLLCCAACSKNNLAYDAVASPRLLDYAISSANAGTEESQTVTVSLQFDRPVAIAGQVTDYLRLAIAGNRVQAEDCDWQLAAAEAQAVEVRIRVRAVTNGRLELGPLREGGEIANITDPDKNYPVAPFNLSGLIPTGVQLTPVSSRVAGEETGAQVVKEVTGRWNIRSITWVRLLENGRTVESSVAPSLELLDGAIAVHGHDFLTADREAIAQDICDTLTAFLGEAYIFTRNGAQVIVEKPTAAPGTGLDLEVYLYQKLQ